MKKTKITIENISETKNWLFEKITNFDKALSRFSKQKREKT